MSGYGPEFARGLIADLDRAVAELEVVIVNGRARDFTHYQALVAERNGLIKARGAIVSRLDAETRQMLGLPPPPRSKPRPVVG